MILLTTVCQAVGQPETISHHLVEVVTGRCVVPVPLPTVASALRKRLADPQVVEAFTKLTVENNGVLVICEEDGTAWRYIRSAGQESVWSIDPAQSFSNYSFGLLGAVSDLRQRQVVYDVSSDTYVLTMGTGAHRDYRHGKLRCEALASGNAIFYEYDKEGRLIQAQMVSGDGKESLAWVKWRGEEQKVVEGSDGLSILYTFDESGRVLSMGPVSGGHTRYEYDSEGHLVRYEQPDGYFVSLAYDGAGRVVHLAAPIGHDAVSLPLASYSYGVGYTEVADAQGALTCYRHCDGRVTAKEEYGFGEAISRSERFWWAPEGYLLSNVLLDDKDQAIWCRNFEYDGYGNVIKETLYGNLTGLGAGTFSVNESGIPSSSGVESFATYYVYDELHRVVRKNNDKDIETSFAYVGDSDLVKARWISDDHGVQLRFLYAYNSAGQVTNTIIDNGQSDDASDLSGVTQRRSVSVAYMGGNPLLVDEKYYDILNDNEMIQKTHLYQYDNRGRVVEKQAIDGEGVCYQMTRVAHDDMGRVVSASDDGDGIRQYRYDAVGRVISSRDSDKELMVSSTYDLAGRLIATDVTDSKKRTFHRSHRYDPMGRCIATVDIYGNETEHVFDVLGREVRTVYPANNDGVRPVIERVYDVCDRVIQVTDPNGFVTSIHYNVYGNPTSIQHADGTEELFEYDLDGSLRRSIAPNGVTTSFERDFLSRVVQKSLMGSAGDEYCTEASYDVFDIAATTDPMGQHILFKRDNAGRLVSKIIDWSEGSAQVDFDYDQRDNLINAKVWFGYNDGDYLQAQIERSGDGKATGYQLLDGMNNRLVSDDYLQPENWSYGEDAHVDEDFAHIDGNGQRVLRRTVTSQDGTVAITTHDALGRSVEVQVLDPFGAPRSALRNRYDASGNLIERSQEVVEGGVIITEVTNYSYGPVGRLESIVRHAGTMNASSTLYQYNGLGQLSRMIKPNGVCMDLAYDEFGRVQRLIASDDSVDYFYRYDALNRPVEVVDHRHGQAVSRRYHPLGGIEYEDLAGGLEITKAFDRQGRVERIVLPDGSGIGYEYDAARLVAIKRLSATGQCLYSHDYNRFDDLGRPTKVTQVGDAGTVSFTWDRQGQLKDITSKWWSQKIDQRDDAGNVLVARTWDMQGRHTLQYTYDALGRIVEEKGVSDRRYSYDAFGSRIEGVQDHTKDSNGNVILREVDGVTQELRYDALDRLTEVVIPGVLCCSYTYDGFGRRMTKTVTEGDGLPVTVRYLYDGDKEIGAVDYRGHLVELRLLGIGIKEDVGAAVAMELDGKVYAPIHDWRGNVVCLVAADGNVVESYRYSAFGLEELYNIGGDKLSPWRFSSKRIDDEVGLSYFGRRYYDAHAGRWLTADPLGNVDGPNLYAFVRNNPLSFVDPQGLFSIPDFWGTMPDLWGTTISKVFHYVRQLGSLGRSITDLLDDDLGLFEDMMDDFRFVTEVLVGPTLQMFAGLQFEPVQFGVCGNGEFNQKVRVSFINGMLNDSVSVYNAAKAISESHGGVNVHYTFRPTDGWTGDIRNGIVTLVGFTSPVASRLAEGWRQLIDEMGGVGNGGVIVHYAHSLGGAETYCACSLMTPEELKMIRIVTFGSVRVLPKEGLRSVKQYVSWLDFAMLVDPVHYLHAMTQGSSTVSFLPHEGMLLVDDHGFLGTVYSKMLAELGRRFVALYDPSVGDVFIRP